MAKKEGGETPLMKQYYATKAKYPDAILLYRMGDFYETFGEDAVTTSRILASRSPNARRALRERSNWQAFRSTP